MINIHLYPSPFLNESRILREARTLERLGLFEHIHLVGAGRSGLPATEDVSDRVSIHRIGERSDNISFTQKLRNTLDWSTVAYRRYRKEPVTCINCHSVATLPLGVRLKRSTGARIIYDAHELETEANGLRGIRKRLTKITERSLIRHADHCIFVGDAIDRWYRSTYGIANTTVLYNCPALGDVEGSDLFRERFRIAARQPVFLYQGVIGEGRGIRLLAEAFRGLGERAALVIMGYGPLTNWVKAEAEKTDNLFYHPAVPPHELLAHTAAADYGLSLIEPTSLSYDYCMPNKLFEYVMASKPLVVSPTVEQKAFVHRYGIGEVADELTPEAIQAAVIRLLSKPRDTYLAALARARLEFCWDQQEKRLEAVYHDALGFRATPRSDHPLDGLVT